MSSFFFDGLLCRLDCFKSCKALAAGAPTTQQHICEECRNHFDVLCRLLRGGNIDFTIDPRLVRGLDYYTRTVFEIHHATLGARSAICGGGRYDGLIEEIGGPPTPATGFSLGVEAVIMAMKKEKIRPPQAQRLTAFLCPIGERSTLQAALLAVRLRAAGLYVELGYEGRSLKSQMKQADKLNATFAVIIGDDELAQKSVRLREMATGTESVVSMEALASKLTAQQ